MKYCLLFILTGCGRIGYDPMSLKEDLPTDRVVYVDHANDAHFNEVDSSVDSSVIGSSCSGKSFIKEWHFDSNVDGWDSSNPGPKPSWNSTFGHDKPGSLEMSFEEGNIQGWVYFLNVDPAIKNKTFSAWFYMEGEINAFPYSQGPLSGYNSDNVTFFNTGVWTCASLKIGDDADMVGFGLNGLGPAKIYLDDVGYE